MKKRSLANLSLNKSYVSNLQKTHTYGGQKTTDQSTLEPSSQVPLPTTHVTTTNNPHSLDPHVCPTRSCNSICQSVCVC